MRWQTHASQGRYEVVLERVSVHLRNTFRPLDTRFFNTPVTRAHVERRRHDLAVIFDLRGAVTPTVTQGVGEGGFQFVYVDFPGGQWVTEPATVETTSTPTDTNVDGSRE